MLCILIYFLMDLVRAKENRMEENKSIGCSVASCKYHAETDYCTLNKIQVGTHEPHPTQVECTDCESFVVNQSVK